MPDGKGVGKGGGSHLHYTLFQEVDGRQDFITVCNRGIHLKRNTVELFFGYRFGLSHQVGDRALKRGSNTQSYEQVISRL